MLRQNSSAPVLGVDQMSRLIAGGLFSILACISVSSLLPAENGYTQDEIISITKDLGKKVDMSEDRIGDLVRNFSLVSEQDEFKAATKGRAISAVFVYRSTEAGLLYKRMSGHGFVTFRQGKTAKIKLTSSSLGAQIGGSAEWGLGLVIGLNDFSHFGGNYAGRKKSATAADSTTAWGDIFSNSGYSESSKIHDICFILTGRGLSAGIGKGKITISLEE
jgi:hypothetical protein